MYYHAIPFKKIRYGVLKANPAYSDKFYQRAYYWLEQHLGFYPLFLAVGNDTSTPYEMTGFNANFKTRVCGYSERKQKPVNCRNPDTLPNMVLFRFERSDIETLHYQDYDAWHGILNTYCYDATEAEWSSSKSIRLVRRLTPIIFKPDWQESEWLQKANKTPGTVQAVTAFLDLRRATRIYCKNRKTIDHLRNLGFTSMVKYKPSKFEKPHPFS
jgi:hypothetical protein